MKAGFVDADITPAIGMESPANYMKRYIESIHDPLKVRVALFDDHSERVVLVGIDTGIFTCHTKEKAKKKIGELVGIPPENILIGASHTHTGGPLFGFHPLDELQDAPELVRRLAFEFSINIDPDYEDFVVWRLASAIKEADRLKENVSLSFGNGREGEVSFNRRFKMRNGKTVTHPGKMNPDIVAPAGPIDPEVGVIGAWREDGTLLGCVVNFTCHGTTFSGLTVSAGWVGYMEDVIKGGMNEPDATIVFLNGACGDVTQIDNLTLRESGGSEESSHLVGTRVGAEALKVLVSSEKGDQHKVKINTKALVLKKRIPSPASIKKAQANIQKLIDRPDTHASLEWIFSKERVLLDYLVRIEPETPISIQAIQIGPAIFISMPGENFCQNGLNVKKSSKFPFTWIVAYTEGLGYIPTEDAFTPEGGGYETVLTSFSCLDTRAASSIEETCIKLSHTLTPGLTPQGPQVSAQVESWKYGTLGPELD